MVPHTSFVMATSGTSRLAPAAPASTSTASLSTSTECAADQCAVPCCRVCWRYEAYFSAGSRAPLQKPKAAEPFDEREISSLRSGNGSSLVRSPLSSPFADRRSGFDYPCNCNPRLQARLRMRKPLVILRAIDLKAPPTKMNPMPRQLPIVALLLFAVLGCDNAAEQHQADQARNAAIANELREQGEILHNDQTTEPAIKDAANDMQ